MRTGCETGWRTDAKPYWTSFLLSQALNKGEKKPLHLNFRDESGFGVLGLLFPERRFLSQQNWGIYLTLFRLFFLFKEG